MLSFHFVVDAIRLVLLYVYVVLNCCRSKTLMMPVRNEFALLWICGHMVLKS